VRPDHCLFVHRCFHPADARVWHRGLSVACFVATIPDRASVGPVSPHCRYSVEGPQFSGRGASFSVKALFVFGFARDVNPRPGFRSLSKRVQLFVSQHLRRSRYDYRLVWRTFTERTSRHLDQNAFCEAVVRWASETFNTLSVDFVAGDGSKRQFILGASTAVAGVADLGLAQTDASRSIAMLGSSPDPIDLDNAKNPGWKNSGYSIRIFLRRAEDTCAYRWQPRVN